MAEYIIVRQSDIVKPPFEALSVAEQPSDSRKEYRELIPGLWGLTPLKNLAAHLALHGSWPEPAEPRKPPPLTTIVECRDAWDEGRNLRFPQLLVGSVEGRYLSDPAVGIKLGEPGSIVGLEQECVELASELEIPEDHLRVERELLDLEAASGAERWRRFKYEALGGIVLLRACRVGIREHASLSFERVCSQRPRDVGLTYHTAFYFSADRFCGCRLLQEGATVEFAFCSGDVYRVPTPYLMSWYDLEPGRQEPSIREVVLHPDEDEGAALVIFSDDRETLVSWDAVLMACEPEYEDYGSLTERGRGNIEKWMERAGPFRVPTDESQGGVVGE